MAFKDFNLNTKTLNRLKSVSCNNTFSHAYILSGEAGAADTLNIAREFVKAAYCIAKGQDKPCGTCLPCQRIEHENHEDVIYLEKEGSTIKVKQIENLLKSLSVKPSSSDRITVVISEADKMTPQSQNKLLKTLEEPAPGYIIVLISENPEKLLETVQSRCVLIHIEKNTRIISEIESAMNSKAAVLIDKLIDKAPYSDVTQYMDSVIQDKEMCLVFLDSLEVEFNNRLKSCVYEGNIDYDTSDGIARILTLIGEVRRDLTLNVSMKYTMRNLMICMGDLLSA